MNRDARDRHLDDRTRARGHEPSELGRLWLERMTARRARYTYALALFPIALIVVLYGAWAVAWVALGRAPQPSIDLPREIHWALGVAYAVFVSGSVMMAPLLIVQIAVSVGDVLQQWALRPVPLQRFLAPIVVPLATWTIAGLLLSADPGRAAEWLLG